MTIKQQPNNRYGLDLLNVHEDRPLSGNVDGWVFVIRWAQHQTWEKGQMIDGATPRLEIKMVKDGKSYKGTIWLREDGTYKADDLLWYKVNPQRENKIDPSTILADIDLIFNYYKSPEGQQKMFDQAQAEAAMEIADLKERIAILEAWTQRLQAEAEAQ